jgi:hypothetical protein
MVLSSAASGALVFTPKTNSYFYETMTCQAANTNVYDSISFSIKGPAGGSVSLEIQTTASCSQTAYTSKYHTVTGLTGAVQTVTIPLKSFTGANLNAITGFVWYGFSKLNVAWQVDDIQFVCSASGTTTSSGNFQFVRE